MYVDPNIKLIVVNTGVMERVGGVRRGGGGWCRPQEVAERILEVDGEYVAIVPDIAYPFAEHLLSMVIPRLRSADVVIVVARPMDALGGLLRRVAGLGVLRRITGHPLGFMIVFRRRLLRGAEVRGDNIAEVVLSRAVRVTSLVFETPGSDLLLNIYGRLPYPVVAVLTDTGRIMRFASVGASGALVNIAVVNAAAAALGASPGNPLSYILPALLGFEASLSWNFLLHETWTFRDMRLGRGFFARLKRWAKYHVASLLSLGVQASSIAVLAGLAGYSLSFAAMTGIVLGFAMNYVVGKLYTWREKRD